MGRDTGPDGRSSGRCGFNPRARVGRDVEELLNLTIFSSFNPRARVGRDLDGQRRMCRRTWFQSTRPRGARPGLNAAPLVPLMFQSTRPRGARQTTSLPPQRVPRFQSTRPRGARPRIRYSCRALTIVSIHAPAWGATSGKRGADRRLRRFNPRARVGRDMARNASLTSSTRFNPRARVGRDWPRTTGTQYASSFNPRARVGRDHPRRCTYTRPPPFQSTRPRGARQGSKPSNPKRQPFQSTRPRGARRRARACPPNMCGVSIHAPAWGATASS